MRSWVEANAFVGKGKCVLKGRRMQLHVETNVFARECKTHVRYTLHLSVTLPVLSVLVIFILCICNMGVVYIM